MRSGSTSNIGEASLEWMLDARGCRSREGPTDDRQSINIPREHETLLYKDCRIWVQGRQEAAHNHNHSGRAQHMWEGPSICGEGRQAPEMLS